MKKKERHVTILMNRIYETWLIVASCLINLSHAWCFSYCVNKQVVWCFNILNDGERQKKCISLSDCFDEMLQQKQKKKKTFWASFCFGFLSGKSFSLCVRYYAINFQCKHYKILVGIVKTWVRKRSRKIKIDWIAIQY